MPVTHDQPGLEAIGEFLFAPPAAQPVIFDVPSLDWDFERLAFQEATRLFKTDAPVGCARCYPLATLSLERLMQGIAVERYCAPMTALRSGRWRPLVDLLGYPLVGLPTCELLGTTIIH